MSQRRIDSFSLSALEHIAQIIGDRYTGSEITSFFRKAGFPEIRHDGTTKWRFVYGALEEIQSKPHGPYQVAKIIEQLCNPEEYFGNAEGHKQIVNEINEILSFYGLAIDVKAGKILVTGKTDASLRSRESEEASFSTWLPLTE